MAHTPPPARLWIKLFFPGTCTSLPTSHAQTGTTEDYWWRGLKRQSAKYIPKRKPWRMKWTMGKITQWDHTHTHTHTATTQQHDAQQETSAIDALFTTWRPQLSMEGTKNPLLNTTRLFIVYKIERPHPPHTHFKKTQDYLSIYDTTQHPDELGATVVQRLDPTAVPAKWSSIAFASM